MFMIIQRDPDGKLICDGATVTTRLQGWSQDSRFVVVRERVQEGKEAVGRKLIDVPGYTFRIWETKRADDPLEFWRD